MEKTRQLRRLRVKIAQSMGYDDSNGFSGMGDSSRPLGRPLPEIIGIGIMTDTDDVRLYFLFHV
jgi:hypothetical protein